MIEVPLSDIIAFSCVIAIIITATILIAKDTYKRGKQKKETITMKDTIKIFVYGSLMSGESNVDFCPVISRKPATMVRDAKLYNIQNYFPALYITEGIKNSVKVKGELIEVLPNYLKDLDSLEACRFPFDPENPYNLYYRTTTDVKLEDGSIVTAWVYAMSYAKLFAIGARETNLNDWRRRHTVT